MDESMSATEFQSQEDLFSARDQVESLTKRFIENLVASRETLARQTALLSTVLDSIGDGVIVFDSSGAIILANREAIRLAGLNMQQLSRSEFVRNYTFFKEDGRTPLPQSEEPYAVALKERRSVQMEGLATGAPLQKGSVWIRVNASPIVDDQDEIIGAVTVFNDITERKRLQTQRDSLGTLITHDLNNHLVGETLFLSRLEGQIVETSASKKLDLTLLAELKQSSEKFLSISNTLLELQRTDLKEIDSCRTEIDVLELLASVIEMNSYAATASGVSVTLNDEEQLPSIRGIATVVHQIFHNLVQNAIRVSAAGETVNIVASSSTTHIIVDVKDNGPGMPPDQVEKLFKASQVTTKLPTSSFSHGFALFLCRMLIETQGGTISCTSEIGSGTTFTVELPFLPNGNLPG